MFFIDEEPEIIECEGVYSMHLQGISINSKGDMFWSWTNELVRTNMQGEIQKKVKVSEHHGDVFYKDEQLFVAVNLGEFNKSAAEADSWVFVYDANSLKEIARYSIPELIYGAGTISFHDGKFIVAGGLASGITENYLYEYSKDFSFLKGYTIPSGFILMGIQTSVNVNGYWLLGCYGDPNFTLLLDNEFQLIGRKDLDTSLGIANSFNNKILIGTNNYSEDLKGFIGRATSYNFDKILGEF
jgi:hypothetical protein